MKRMKLDSSNSTKFKGFPGGSVIKDLPANAGDMGSIPGLGRSHMLRSKSAHEPQVLSLCSRAWELQLLKPCGLYRNTVASTSPTPGADAARSTPSGDPACWNHHLRSLTRESRCQQGCFTAKESLGFLTPPAPRCPIRAERIWTRPPDCRYQEKTDPRLQRQKGQRTHRHLRSDSLQ